MNDTDETTMQQQATSANEATDHEKFSIDDESDDDNEKSFNEIEANKNALDSEESEEVKQQLTEKSDSSSSLSKEKDSSSGTVKSVSSVPLSKQEEIRSTSPRRLVKKSAPPSSTKQQPQQQEASHPPQSHTESEWHPFADPSLFSDPTTVNISISNSPGNKKLERKLSSPPQLERKHSSQSDDLSSLRHIFDTEYERAILHQEISWKARYTATRLSFLFSTLIMVGYLWMGCFFYRYSAGWSIPDALLFTVYTVTTVGYGGPRPLPNSAEFHAFTSLYVLIGISGVTVLGAHTYQLIMLEATRIKQGVKRRNQQHYQTEVEGEGFEQETTMDRFRKQFMTELEDRVRERPALDRALDGMITRFKEVKIYMESTRSGRVLGVMLPFVGLIFLGAVVVGLIEGWTPLESIYWSIVTLTTVGYGDYTPTKNSSVWFCTLFFIPSSLFFLSFFLTHVAKSYIRLHAIHVTRLERRMRDKAQRQNEGVKRAERAKQNANAGDNNDNNDPDTPTEQALPKSSSGGSSDAEELESGFTTISYTEDEDINNSRRNNMGLFGDGTGLGDSNSPSSPSNSYDTTSGMRYRESVIRNKFTAPDPGKRAISFGEALQSLNQSTSQSSGESTQHEQSTTAGRQQVKENSAKPSLEVRLRVQERIARIIAEEVAGFQSDVTIKGSTVSLTISNLHDTADKWAIPPQAWKAFRAISFRCLLFVGERDLISDGGEALFHLNAIEFHGIFSPMLAAMGDGMAMEEWLGRTDILAEAEFGDGRGRVARGNVSPTDVFRGTFT